MCVCVYFFFLSSKALYLLILWSVCFIANLDLSQYPWYPQPQRSQKSWCHLNWFPQISFTFSLWAYVGSQSHTEVLWVAKGTLLSSFFLHILIEREAISQSATVHMQRGINWVQSTPCIFEIKVSLLAQSTEERRMSREYLSFFLPVRENRFQINGCPQR